MQTEEYLRKLFKVDRNTISKWRYHFSEYLSPSAIQKGETRQYTESDIRVLALINEYWEDDPDYENICAKLNSREQDDERYFEIVYSSTPVFKEVVPDDVYEDSSLNRGVILYSQAMSDPLLIARAYKYTGDLLVDEAFRYDESPWEMGIAYTIFYTYRHALELYLKILVGYDFEHGPNDKTPHSLLKLLGRYKEMIAPKDINPWVTDFLGKFEEIDKQGTSFRYPKTVPDHIYEWWVDFRHLRTAMDLLCRDFESLTMTKM